MKPFFYKLLFLIFTIFILQIVISTTFYKSAEITLLNNYLDGKTNILFFGDSSIRHLSQQTGIGGLNLAEMISEKIGQNIGNVSYPGYHLDIYAAQMDYIVRSFNKPKIVIIPLQLRSFSPEWDMRPVNQFEKTTFLLTDSTNLVSYFYKPLAIFRAIETNSVPYETFLQTPVNYGSVELGKVKDFEAVNKNKSPTPENIKNDFIYKYMQDLNTNHRKLESLKKLIELGKKHEIKIMFYISPIDYETGTKIIGSDFQKITESNSEIICSFINQFELPCLNTAFILNSEYFDYPSYPNEHLNELGRKILAEKITNFFFK